MKRIVVVIVLIVTVLLLWFFATKNVLFRFPIDSVSQMSSIHVDSIPVISDGNSRLNVTNFIKQDSPTENVGVLTFFVNGINNIISTYGVVLAFLTLLFGLVGYFSYKAVDDTIKEHSVRIVDKITELNALSDVFKSKMQSVEKLEMQLKTQEKYVDKSTTQIYEVIYKMASLNPQQGKFLIESITNDKQLLHLFSGRKDDRMAALLYFGEKGTKDHIVELYEVSRDDLDEEIRQLAAKVIGRIEQRERNVGYNF